MIGVWLVIIAAGLLLQWLHVRMARFDRDFRQQLPGVWLRQEANMWCTNTVSPDGAFTCHSLFIHPDRTNTYVDAGTWVVQDGRLVETVTNDTNPTAVTPRWVAGRIIHADASQFTVRWPNSAEVVWRRIPQ